MQAAIAQLGYESVVIAQPSLLLGNPSRPGTTGAQWRRVDGTAGRTARLDGAKTVRPIPARAVASALLAAILDAKPGVHVLKSETMARTRPTLARSSHNLPAGKE